MGWGPGAVYGLCLLTSGLCAALLFRSYSRSRQPLLLWSAVCFSLLAINNLLVVFDMVVFRATDFSVARQVTALAAVGVLIYGFIWEVDR
ncbi:MAG TPA: DUF5985 family protein [Brevundimonas sp.]|nr:DUF5985 family protein [Brevundimonas sp.]